MYYYFDEAGQPDILGHKGINLIEKGTASKVFMVGYLETEEHKKIASDLRILQKQIAEDEYLNSIPSIANTKKMFHANKDCAEVREKVFKLLKTENFTLLLHCCPKKRKLI